VTVRPTSRAKINQKSETRKDERFPESHDSRAKLFLVSGFWFLVYPTSSCPVSTRYASRYFSRVLSTTSAGNSGAGGFLFQPVDSSQSRTNCLSYDGGFLPTAYWSAGQKREESGVSASSIQTIFPPA